MHDSTVETLSASLYRDVGVYESERRAVFSHAWLLLGHESQLAGAGSYIAITIAGYPLFAVRDKEGTIRAFHNVCRHRAGPLVPDGAGMCGEAIQCRYHGWRYALDGRLAVARDFGPATDFDPRSYGLIPLASATWHGFVFANMDTKAEPLAAAIAPLERRTHDRPVDRFAFARQSSFEIRCNWKTYVENYLEGYHIPLVHPGLDAAIDAARYEIEIEAPMVFHRAPIRSGAAVAGLWAWLWPCLGVNVYADGMMMERISPIDHANTRLDYLYFFPPDLTREEMDRAIASSEATTAEDIAITEAVQRNLDAGIYDKGRLSPRHEGAIAWFQQTVVRTIGSV